MNQEIRTKIETIKAGQVPEGYKKTKIGVVPSEWNDIKFSKLFDEYSNYTEDLSKYPLYSLTIEEGVIPKTDRYERSHLVKKENAYKIVPQNHFVYNPMNVRFGAVARYLGDNPVAVSGYYDVFVTKQYSDGAFMDSFLISPKMISYYNRVSTGSLVEKQRVHFSQFMEFNLPLPSKLEREKIAEILSTQDRVITLKEERIEAKKQQKKYLNFSILNISKNEGKVCSLNNFIKLKSGYAFKSKNYVDNGKYKVITIANVQKNKMCMDRTNTLDKLPSNIQKHQLLQRGDILVSLTGNVGRVCSVNLDDCLLNQRVGKIEILDNSLKDYIYCLLQDEKFIYSMQKAAQGAAQGNLANDDINEYVICIPYKDKSIDYQKINKIVAILSTADREIELLERDLEQEKQKKKALMQLLLTGIVRV